jgi:hypothetical protein
MKQRSQRPLPQESSVTGFRFASCCEAWLCPAVSELRFQLGYALKLLHWKHIEGEAQNQLSLAHGRAEPCLTTAGKAESNETALLRQSRSCEK